MCACATHSVPEAALFVLEQFLRAGIRVDTMIKRRRLNRSGFCPEPEPREHGLARLDEPPKAISVQVAFSTLRILNNRPRRKLRKALCERRIRGFSGSPG